MTGEAADRLLDLPRLIGVLNAHRVEYVVIGGLAINVHGVARATYDLDVAIAGGRQNLQRVAAALSELKPSLRGAPAGLPISFDAATLGGAETWTLRTDAGDLDLMVRPEGTTGYDELVADALVVDVFGTTIRVASFDAMRRMKRAAGRPKDLGDLADLEALAQARSSEE